MEKEQNDNYYSANKIETDSVVEGSLGTPVDHDFFRLDIISPVIMDIELSAVKGLNHAVKIWKEGGRVLKYIDDSRKSSPERMCNMYFDLGTYYIEILHGDRDKAQGNIENNYQLRLNSRDWDSEELESNDTYENSNLLEPGIDVKGYFSPSFNKMNQSADFPFREEDWYYFNIELIDESPMLLDISLSGVPDVNSTLYIMDSERNEIASSNIGSTGEGELLEGIGITGSGRYYILVVSNLESNHSIPYILQTTLKSYDYLSEIEPNNNFENANLLMENEITGRIYPEGDKDCYILNSQANDISEIDESAKNEPVQYRIEVLSQGIDIIMKIFNEKKRQIFEIDNIKGGGREVLPNVLLNLNSYIEISSRRGEITGSEYRLNIKSFPFTENYEIEPNDIKENANRMKTGRITGFISKKKDVDYFLLEYKRRVKAKIKINGIEGAELKISITDPLGFIIKTETVKDNYSISINEMIDQKGYLVVESVLDNFDEPYIIELGE